MLPYMALVFLFYLFFWSSSMSVPTKQQAFLKASLRLFAVLAFFGVMLATNQPTASAQDCDASVGCPVIRIVNCTWEPMRYVIEPLLCCDGRAVVGPRFRVPAAISPDECSISRYVAPEPCVVIGIWSINPPPPFGWYFDLANCTLYLY